MLEGRLQTTVDPQIQQEQHGSHPGRGRVDQNFTFAELLSELLEFASPVYICFVDMAKAYDHVLQSILWGLLPEYEGPDLHLNVIWSLYNQNRICVCIGR